MFCRRNGAEVKEGEPRKFLQIKGHFHMSEMPLYLQAESFLKIWNGSNIRKQF